MTEYRPRIRPQFRCDVVEGFGLVLETDADLFLGRGDIYERLAPLLNGSHTVQDILEAVEPSHDPMEVFGVLNHMRDREVLVDGAHLPFRPEQDVFWDQLDMDLGHVAAHLQRQALSVRAFGDLPYGFQDHFDALVQENDLRVQPGSAVSVVLTDSYGAPGLDQFQRDARKQGHRVLMMRLAGTALWVGPEFSPDHTGCWECLFRRVDAHGKMDRFLATHEAQRRQIQSGRAGLPSIKTVALGIAATEATKWIASGFAPTFVNRVHAIDTQRLDRSEHVLVRHPACGSCGLADTWLPTSRAENLEARRQPESSGGAELFYRTRPPEETVAQLRHHVSPVTGIITSFQKVTAKTKALSSVYCYVADHVFTPMNGNLDRLREGREGRASGKGQSDIQAQASALGEALERYSGVFQGTEEMLFGPLSDFFGLAFHPNDLMLFSEGQFKVPDEPRSVAGGPAWRPEKFPLDLPTDWTPVWSLTEKTRKFVPTALCYYGHGQQRDVHFARADSNGCAAGNTIDEAILQGFLELVERDAVALWWYNRVQRPAVDLAGFGNPYLLEIAEIHRELGRDLWVLDLTTDLGIPSFAAISRQVDQTPERPLFGFGAHLDAGIAVSRAITEVNQGLSLLRDPAEAGPAGNSILGDPAFSWWQDARLEAHPYWAPDASLCTKQAADFPQGPSSSIFEAVEACVARARACGLEVLVLDQTRPDTGLTVVKVFVPGLRHFWPRFAPGRLYDIPVQLGWLDTPRKEEALNPAHFFL